MTTPWIPFHGSARERLPTHQGGRDFVCTCAFSSFRSSSIRSYLARSVPIRLILLTFKNISLFHRWFYGLAKVGIMQRGKFCSVNFSPADAAESPKNRNWTKGGIKNKIQTQFQNVFYTKQKNISIYEKMGKISIGGSICS